MALTARETVSPKRPKNLDPLALMFKLPVAAVTSLLHRASGAILFLMLPGMIALLDRTLRDESTFNALVAMLRHPISKIVILIGIWALLHHLCAGIRFLLLDMHWGIDRPKPRFSAWLTIGVSLILSAFVGGVLLW